MKRIFVLFYLCTLTAAETIKFKHPHESNFNNEQLLEQFHKIENIRKTNADSVPFYQRLVKYLFRKQRFQADPGSENYFVANIPLKISKEQYELLVNSDISGLNINEIDGLVEEVIKQSTDESWQQSAVSILYEHYRQELIQSVTSFSSPVLWIILSLLSITVLNKIFHFSRFKFITILFTSFLMICGISYYMTYLDCMHDLEVEEIMHLSKEAAENNPCKQYHKESENFWSSVKTFISGSKKNECHEYMKKTLNPSTKYCNPLEVFFKWLAKLHMSYFGAIFKEFTEFFAESTSSMDFASRFLSKILYLLFFGISTILFIVVFIKYSIQTVPSVISHTSKSSTKSPVQDTSMAILSAKMDEILRENVQIKREISVIRERSVEPQLPPPVKKKHKLSAIEEAAQSKSEDSTDSSEYS